MSAVEELTYPELARRMRDKLKDKSYRAFPLGQEAGHYLRFKRKRLTEASYRDYEGGLDKLARFFADLELRDLEPPVGTERIEEFLDHQYGTSAPRTYNKNLSILRDFFKFQVVRGKMRGDPTLAVERARARQVHREIFNPSQIRAIIAANDELRDRIALRLLLDYGIRKGSLRRVQFKHFDHHRRRLTIFTKGEKVQSVPLVDPMLWRDLDLLTLLEESQPHHYLLPRQLKRPSKFDPHTKKALEFTLHRFHGQPMGEHGLHSWWYRCLHRAGIVATGIESGERMHKARHTAGQRALDASGNIVAAKKLLGHASESTTADIYVDWDLDQLAETLSSYLLEDES